MIDRQKGNVVFKCDTAWGGCGEELETPTGNYNAALNFMKREGWYLRKIVSNVGKRTEGWQFYCVRCQRKGRHTALRLTVRPCREAGGRLFRRPPPPTMPRAATAVAAHRFGRRPGIRDSPGAEGAPAAVLDRFWTRSPAVDDNPLI
jgi:hypothetical protein